AERDHHFRIVARDHHGKTAEGSGRIVGRQQHAARGKAGTFFQMQVRDHEQALLLPEQGSGKIRNKGNAGDIKGGNAHDRPVFFEGLSAYRHGYPVASLTSSSAVSASNSSDASP